MTAIHPARDRCAIAGIGATDFSKSSGRSDLTLAAEASLAAIRDAGLTPDDVDGIVRCDLDHVTHHALASTLGIKELTYWGEVGPGGVAPAAMIGQAVGALLGGLATAVLVFRSLNGRSGRRYGSGFAGEESQTVGGDCSFDEYYLPFGLLTPGQLFAMIAQRHMQEFGTRVEDLAAIALACRNRANANPAAQMHDRVLTMEDYLEARMISTPLCLYDFCLETDGACAAIITTTERARDMARPPVLIRAVAQCADDQNQGGMCFPTLLRDEITTFSSARTAQLLYRRAGLGPSDVDVAQFYDCFTITALVQIEDYGFCPKGEGGPFASSGAIELGGELPMNTAGGHLSEGYIHGMNHIIEGVRQMRGESFSQVPGAETCLVTSSPPTASALLLRRS